MAISLSLDDYKLIARNLDAILAMVRKTNDLSSAKPNRTLLVKLLAADDDSFRRHMVEAIREMEDA